MKKTFFQNLIFLILLNVLVKPLWVLGVDRPVQNIVGHENYGLYFALFNFSFLFSIVLDLGFTNYNSRIIAQQPTLIKKYFSNILFLKLILTGIYFAVTLIASLGFHLVDSNGFILLLILCFNQVLSSLILYLRSNISAMHYFKTDSLLSVLDKLLMIIFFAVLVYAKPFGGEFKIEWFIYSQTLSYGITMLVAFFVLFSLVPRPSFNLDLSNIKIIWRESYPLAILVLLMSVYGKIDSVMIKQLLGSEGNRETGIYASAFRLMDAANQFGFLFAALLLPIFSRMISKKSDVEGLVLTSFKTIFIFSFLLAIVCTSFRTEIMRLLYDEYSDYSALTLAILMFALIGSSTQYIFGTLLTANRNLKQLNRVALGAVLLNILLNYLLIPDYGCIGAAVACLITQFFVGITQIAVSRKVFRLRVDFKLVVSLLTYTLLLIIIATGIKYLAVNWAVQLILVLVIGLFLAFALRLFEIRKVTELLKVSGQE